MFTYAQVGGGLRLDYTLADHQLLDDVAWGMLSNNEIAGIQPVRRSQLDNHVVLHYDVVGQCTLREFIGRSLGRADVVWILGSIVAALSSAESYMIATDRFVLDPELVFVNTHDRAVSLICVPVSGGLPSDPLAFFKRVTCDLRFDESEDTSYVGELMGSLNGQSVLDLAQFGKVIHSVEMRTAAPRIQGAPPQAAPHGNHEHQGPPTGMVGQPGGPVQHQAAPTQFAQAPTMSVSQAPQAPPAPAHVPPPHPLPTMPLGFSVPGRPGQVPASPGQAPGALSVQAGPMGQGARSGVKGPQGRAAAAGAPGDEPAVSLFYLLQHYTKANKEIYDRQRQARAALKAEGKSQRGAVAALPPAVPGQPSWPTPAQGQVRQTAPMIPQPGGGLAPYPAGGPSPIGPGPSAGAPMHGIEAPEGFGETVYFGGLGASAGLEAARHAAAGRPSQSAGPATASVPPAQVVKTVPHASLHHSVTGETVRIEKQVFVIGRGKSGVDYLLRDRTVSNSHAIIYANSDGYSIIDNNSLNGVYVDGRQIVPVQRAALPPHAEIRIGDEVVSFRIDR